MNIYIPVHFQIEIYRLWFRQLKDEAPFQLILFIELLISLRRRSSIDLQKESDYISELNLCWMSSWASSTSLFTTSPAATTSLISPTPSPAYIAMLSRSPVVDAFGTVPANRPITFSWYHVSVRSNHPMRAFFDNDQRVLLEDRFRSRVEGFTTPCMVVRPMTGWLVSFSWPGRVLLSLKKGVTRTRCGAPGHLARPNMSVYSVLSISTNFLLYILCA